MLSLPASRQVASVMGIVGGVAAGGKALFDIFHSLENIKSSQAELTSNVQKLEANLKADVQKLEVRLEADAKELKAELKSAMKENQRQLSDQLSEFNTSVRNDIKDIWKLKGKR